MNMSNEEGMLTKADATVVIPASITTVPNLYHSASGSVQISSAAAEPSTTSFYSLTTSWNVRGDLEVDLTTSWNLGESAYYWYRIESECGFVTCDEFGIEHRDCKKMTLVTTVSARNLAEVCQILSSPRTNAPVTTRISSIKRYGRPMFRDQIQPGQCNTLDEVEFCHIPECLDYCVDPSPSSSILADEEVAVPSSMVSASEFEYEDVPANPMYPDLGVISVCGCSRSALSMPVSHSLNRSSVLSGFLRGAGASLPGILDLTYREDESSWSSSTHLRSGDSVWSVILSLGCQPDIWTVSLSVRGGGRRTRLIFDAPSELVCSSGRPSALIQCYFRGEIASAPLGRSIDVRSPPRPKVQTPVDVVEVFVGGIFVPYTVYYDELGLFKDSSWGTSPLEIDINPISRGRTRTMTLEGIA